MGFWSRVKLILSNAFKQIADFIMPVIKLFLQSYGKILATIAFDAVRNVASAYAGAPDGEKREQAFKEIRSQLDVRKIEVRDSAINLAIEMAITKLKDMQ